MLATCVRLLICLMRCYSGMNVVKFMHDIDLHVDGFGIIVLSRGLRGFEYHVQWNVYIVRLCEGD